MIYLEKIFSADKEIILIGTAHISEKSIELVKETIEREKPEAVGIELCASRFKQLKMGKKWQQLNIGEVIKTGRIYLFLLNLLLSNLQRQLGAKIGVKPGAEMIAAYKIAEEKKVPVILLDRDVQITLKRAFSFIGWGEKLKLLFSIVTSFFSEKPEITKELVEKLKEKDMMTELMNELSKTAPTLKKVLVDERDLFIANSILASPFKKIVAVVGAGHVEGVKKYLDKKRDVSKLLFVPKKKSYLKLIFKWIIPLLFVLIMGYAFFIKGFTLSIQIFLWWFLITGSLSALGALIARAHPLSILAAFLAAPFTTLHPALAAGWFAGYVELRVKNPKVEDFEKLNQLNSMGDFYRNQVTKILLITAFANVGATIGVVIAIPYVLSLLG
ncbi:MAG: TraB/GumN family protein [archaeon]